MQYNEFETLIVSLKAGAPWSPLGYRWMYPPCFLSPYILMYAFHLSRLLNISIKYFALVEKSKLSFLTKHRTLLMKSKAL